MLGNMRISTKLLFVIGVFVVGVIAVAFMGLVTLRQNLVEDRKSKLHDLVLAAEHVVEVTQKASGEAGISEKDPMGRAKTILRSLRFAADDYFFVLDSQGLTV